MRGALQDEKIASKNFLLAKGLSAWGEGQLEEEIQAEQWLIIEPDAMLLFSEEYNEIKWEKALQKMGIKNPLMLTGYHGEA